MFDSLKRNVLGGYYYFVLTEAVIFFGLLVILFLESVIMGIVQGQFFGGLLFGVVWIAAAMLIFNAIVAAVAFSPKIVQGFAALFGMGFVSFVLVIIIVNGATKLNLSPDLLDNSYSGFTKNPEEVKNSGPYVDPFEKANNEIIAELNDISKKQKEWDAKKEAIDKAIDMKWEKQKK